MTGELVSVVAEVVVGAMEGCSEGAPEYVLKRLWFVVVVTEA